MKYPATRTIHWPTGPVQTCDKHTASLTAIARMLGYYVAVTKLRGESECTNCKNENDL